MVKKKASFYILYISIFSEAEPSPLQNFSINSRNLFLSLFPSNCLSSSSSSSSKYSLNNFLLHKQHNNCCVKLRQCNKEGMKTSGTGTTRPYGRKQVPAIHTLESYYWMWIWASSIVQLYSFSQGELLWRAENELLAHCKNGTAQK